MSAMAFKEAAAAWEALAERADQPAELWNAAQRQQWVELVETLARMLPALQHDHINELAEHASREELGDRLASASLRGGLQRTRRAGLELELAAVRGWQVGCVDR